MNTTGTVLVVVLMTLALITKIVQTTKYRKENTPEVDYSKKNLQLELLTYVGFVIPATIIANIMSFNFFGTVALVLFIISAISTAVAQYRRNKDW